MNEKDSDDPVDRGCLESTGNAVLTGARNNPPKAMVRVETKELLKSLQTPEKLRPAYYNVTLHR